MASEVAFTQYMRPDGRAVPVSIERPNNIASLAKKIISKGFKFECEHLSTGQVSLTIVDPNDDVEVSAIEVVENGPDVPIAIDKMIKRFADQIGISNE